MQIGDKVWLFDSNRRVYQDDKGNTTTSPWFRGNFTERYIVGETKRSWLVGFKGNTVEDRTNIKVDKKNLTYSITNNFGFDKKLYISEEEIDRKCWINDNHRKIIRLIEQCSDYDKLLKIQEILSEGD